MICKKTNLRAQTILIVIPGRKTDRMHSLCRGNRIWCSGHIIMKRTIVFIENKISKPRLKTINPVFGYGCCMRNFCIESSKVPGFSLTLYRYYTKYRTKTDYVFFQKLIKSYTQHPLIARSSDVNARRANVYKRPHTTRHQFSWNINFFTNSINVSYIKRQ